jgi:16S rRNA (guanine527-N7)-methyltransferase
MSIPEPRLRELLKPYVVDAMPSTEALAQISRYLDLIILWNARTNLTAVREPEAILQRQIGESLFAARFLPGTGTLLDFGSGAGLPGIPIALLRPGMQITLAESQNKKAGFLREAARTLALPLTIWPDRVENLPQHQQFDVLTMRAVDDSARMIPVAIDRIAPHGHLVRYLGESVPVEIPGWSALQTTPIPNSRGMLQILART